jgi:hypothetical protein
VLAELRGLRPDGSAGINAPQVLGAFRIALEAFEIASRWWPTMVLQLIEVVTRRGTADQLDLLTPGQ